MASPQDDSSLLPIAAYRDVLVGAIRTNPVTIVVGETGCGKTTQLPQYLYQAGLTNSTTLSNDRSNKGKLMLACTQPRRVAAISVAQRVAQELSQKNNHAHNNNHNNSTRSSLYEVGHLVGYSVRFEECWSPHSTHIKYMTDGMLVRECMQDPLLSSYSVVMVDEAHERSLHTDILLGLLKKVLATRSDLRVIISSATLQAERFVNFFAPNYKDDQNTTDNFKPKPVPPPVFRIPGRKFPVTCLYSKHPISDYLEATLKTILQIHQQEPLEAGDILAFLTGQDEIDMVANALAEYNDLTQARLSSIALERSNEPWMLNKDNTQTTKKKADLLMMVVPVYGALPSESQAAIFAQAPPRHRKVVLGTNIAETSITVPNIAFVVDCGMAKYSAYNPRTRTTSLTVTPISRAAAEQRAGRAGRTRPGKCYRLYTAWTFENDLDATTPAEILRSDLCGVVLLLATILSALSCQSPTTTRKDGDEESNGRGGAADELGGADAAAILHFPFLEGPPLECIKAAWEELYLLGALDRAGKVTALGKRMAILPLDPRASRALLAGHEEFGCPRPILDLIAVLGAVSGGWPVFYLPPQSRPEKSSPSEKNSKDDGINDLDRNKRRAISDCEKKQSASGKRQQASAAHRAFAHPTGDHLTLLQVFRQYSMLTGEGERKEWSQRHFLHHRTLRRAGDIREQLAELLRNISATTKPSKNVFSGDEEEGVLRAMLTGYFGNIARLSKVKGASKSRLDGDNESFLESPLSKADGPYRLVVPGEAQGLSVSIHPSSSLFKKPPHPTNSSSSSLTSNYYSSSSNLSSSSLMGERDIFNRPELLLFADLVVTSQPYIRIVSSVDAKWLPPALLQLVERDIKKDLKQHDEKIHHGKLNAPGRGSSLSATQLLAKRPYK